MIFHLVTKHRSNRGDQKARTFSSLPDSLRSKLFLIQEIFRVLANDLISVIFNPPYYISLMIVFLAILPPFPHQIKEKKSVFNSLRKESFGVGSVVKRCTNLDIASYLITCILPMMLKSLQDHESKSCLTSSSFIL